MASDVVRPTAPHPVTAAVPSAGPVVGPRSGQDPEGHLATGWEPHRPLSDGYVRRFVYAYASSFTGLVHHLGGRVARRDDHVIWDLGRASGFYNGAMLLRPLPYDTWERTLDRLEADLLAGGEGEVVLFSPWTTPDLGPRGWHLEGHPPLLVRPRGRPEPPAPSWLEIREVTDARGVRDWERVAVLGYPLADVDASHPGRLVDARILADPALHAWVGYAEGVPVTIGTSYVVHGVNVFALGATMPEHRGRGAWHAMASRRLAAFPRLPAMGLFSDMSRSPAEQLGFVALSRWTAWTRARPAG